MKNFPNILWISCLGFSMLAGCSSNSETQSIEEKTASAIATVEETVDNGLEEIEKTGLYNTIDLASQYDTLLSKIQSNLVKGTYHSDEYSLDIPYGVYVPEDYDSTLDYPLVMFIPDSTLAGQDVNAILEQGYGGVVWAAPEVQTGREAIILYPAYPEVTVDDHNGYTITDYVPATIGLIDQIREDYNIDSNRIYATGQSMGCMTSMILAADNPDLFAACMFVDGQWDANALASLATQTFVYFAAQDDTSAFTGMSQAIPVWEENGADIVQAEWSGEWDHTQLEEAAHQMLKEDSKIYCISWETGTITPKKMGMGGSGKEGNFRKMDGSDGPSGAFEPSDSENPSQVGNDLSMTSGQPQGMNSVAYHMASFDYAYKCNTMVAWLLLQRK